MVDLKDKINQLPKKPGVYLFSDSKDKIIYIGKALSLKHRVASYFSHRSKDPKTQELVNKISKLDFFVVNSEFEALLLEAQLIKEHRPKYNSSLKDDKSYLYIAVSKDKPERIFLAKRVELKSNVSSWYGPFTTSSDARQILKTLRRIFPFRSCKKLLKRPCLYHHLKLCPAPCLALPNTYPETMRKIRLILSGKTANLTKSLEKQMKDAASTLNYEEAQVFKKEAYSLKALTSGWQSVPKEKQSSSKTFYELRKILTKYQGSDPTTLNRIEGYDVSNLGKDIIVGSMVAFVNSEPDKSQYRKFNLKYNLAGQDDPEGIKQIIFRRLNHPEWVYPQLILVDGGKTQLTAAFKAIKERNLEKHISLLGITKEEELIIIPKIAKQKIIAWKSLRLSQSSLILQLLQRIRDESHRFAHKYSRELHAKIITQ